MDLFEMMTGARLTHSFGRIGGVAKDIPDGFEIKTRAALDFLPSRIDEYETPDRQEPHLPQAGQGDRHLHLLTTALPGASPARRCGRPEWSGTCARNEPYAAYPDLDFEVCVEYEADVYARYRVRMREMRESIKIIRQCLDKMPDGRGHAPTTPRT